jgi:NAD(P)-dependent dehydrogenase (short-subunit alcohol dehydrogenase family)
MHSQRWILVAGGSKGIGRGLVAALSDSFTVVSRSRTEGLDFLDERSVERDARALQAERGPPFGLIHTTGDFLEKPLLETSAADWDALLASNLRAALVVLRAWVPAMRAAGGGRVILFGTSGAGQESGKRRAPAYFAVKEAVGSVARSLALELAPAGITVNLVSPGLILHESSHADSQRRMLPRVPAGRLGSPADVTGAVRFLLSEEASYVTGVDLVVDGGLRL